MEQIDVGDVLQIVAKEDLPPRATWALPGDVADGGGPEALAPHEDGVRGRASSKRNFFGLLLG
jgi:hypothetical protein